MATEKTEAKIAWEKTTKESYLEEGEPKSPADVEMPEGGEEEPVEEKAAEPAPEDEEEAPPSSKRPAPPPAAKGPKASLAHLAGLPETASQVAVSTELTRRVQVYEHAQRLTGGTSHGEIIGHLDAMARDAGEVGRLRGERDAAVRKANARERLDLLTKLEAAGGPGHTRGDLFVDEVDANGKRTGVRPAKLWGPGPEGRPLANLRGYVAQKLSNAAPAVKRSPFEPDHKAAAQNGARVTEADQRMAEQNGYDPERVAASRAALFGNSSAPARGV